MRECQQEFLMKTTEHTGKTSMTGIRKFSLVFKDTLLKPECPSLRNISHNKQISLKFDLEKAGLCVPDARSLALIIPPLSRI